MSTAFGGKVLAGTTPIAGASVQLYSAGTTGNGSAPTTLLATAAITDSTGTFAIPASYTCASATSVLYLVARGGTVAGVDNGGIELATALGGCNSVATGSAYVVNEATTVAMAYAMSQFLSTGGFVGASATNNAGLLLAVGTTNNLVDPLTGSFPGVAFPPTGKAPTLQLNSIADILNACLVSSGTGSAACAGLYSATAPSLLSPSNTLDAVYELVRHPGSNVQTLFALSQASSAFSPQLAKAPSDWTLYATFSGGGMHEPSGVAIDSMGNIWVGNYVSLVSDYVSVASLFSNLGQPTFAAGIIGDNLFNTYAVAVSSSDVAYFTNQQSSGFNGGYGSVTELKADGSSPVTLSAGGLNFPSALAFDRCSDLWVVDYGNSHVTRLDSSGNPLSGAAGYTSKSFVFPIAVATDSKCNAYVANESSKTITRVAPDGSSFTDFVTGDGAAGLAVDASDNVWTANYYGNSVGLVSSTSKVLSGAGYTAGGVNHPQGIAVDGVGDAWVANYRGDSLTELAAATSATPGAALSPAAGWGPDAGLLEAFGIAIDAAGNIWVSNFGSATLTEFIGLAVPVKTPLNGPVQVP